MKKETMQWLHFELDFMDLWIISNNQITLWELTQQMGSFSDKFQTKRANNTILGIYMYTMLCNVLMP